MIRESIARHLGTADDATVRRFESLGRPDGVEAPEAADVERHASHLRLPLVSGDEDGACLIEPAVRCNHCGYCLSLGH